MAPLRFSKKIKAATKMTNQPKAMLSFSAFTRVENIDPTTDPTDAPTIANKMIPKSREILVLNEIKVSRLNLRTKPANAPRHFMMTTRSDVAMASLIASPPNRTRAGTTMKPPPAPSMPLMKPANAPSRIKREVLGLWVVSSAAFLRRRIMANPVTAMIIENAKRRMSPGRCEPT